jgi:hypothetical protein
VDCPHWTVRERRTGTPPAWQGRRFRAGGQLAAAHQAKSFIHSLWVGCDGAAADWGAIAYDATGLNATAQAMLGLGGPSIAQLSAAGSVPQAPELVCPLQPPTVAGEAFRPRSNQP